MDRARAATQRVRGPTQKLREIVRVRSNSPWARTIVTTTLSETEIAALENPYRAHPVKGLAPPRVARRR